MQPVCGARRVDQYLRHTGTSINDQFKIGSKKQGSKDFALEFIPTHPNTTGGTPELEFAVKAFRLKTFTEIGTTLNSGQGHATSGMFFKNC